MRIASIDVGSNTVLLLIADSSPDKPLETVLNEYRTPRLSRRLRENGIISDESLSGFYKVLEDYKRIIDSHKCDVTIVKATQAMRKAENRAGIIKYVSRKFGFQIDIISGEEEARFSFLGAISNFANYNNYCVLDIGGSSTEIIVGTKNSIRFRKSFPFGAVYLTEKFFRNNAYSLVRLADTIDFLSEYFMELKDITPSDTFTIAVAGTPTTLSAMNMNLTEYDENAIEGSYLNLNDVESLAEHLRKHTPKELLEIHGNIINGREDVLFAGTLILSNFMKAVGIDIINVSGRGLRYGIVIDYVNSLD